MIFLFLVTIFGVSFFGFALGFSIGSSMTNSRPYYTDAPERLSDEGLVLRKGMPDRCGVCGGKNPSSTYNCSFAGCPDGRF